MQFNPIYVYIELNPTEYNGSYSQVNCSLIVCTLQLGLAPKPREISDLKHAYIRSACPLQKTTGFRGKFVWLFVYLFGLYRTFPCHEILSQESFTLEHEQWQIGTSKLQKLFALFTAQPVYIVLPCRTSDLKPPAFFFFT